MNFLNLRPHTINVYNEYGEEVLNVEPSGFVASIETEVFLGGYAYGVGLYKTIVTGKPIVLDKDKNELPFPPQRDGRIIIVSGLFRSHFDREDIYQPGKLLRDESGKPIGCVGLSK